MHARVIDRNAGPEAREQGAAPTRRVAPAQPETEPQEYGYLDAGTASDSTGVGPRVGGPERDLKSASELPGEAAGTQPEAPAASAQPLAQDEPAPSSPATPIAAQAPATAAKKPDDVAESAKSSESTATAGLVAPPTPEAWYAAIEKLRAEGRTLEAERELEQLEKAYPGWLEEHLKAKARR
jgi:hypothetical protein